MRGSLLALTALGLAWAAESAAVGPRAPLPLLAAHRGGAGLWPENSRFAFEQAVALGADYLELDVHQSIDGEVVVIHDSTLERTTTGRGAVKDRALAELRALRLRDRTGAVTAERIPTLGEVVELAAAARRRLLIEVKVDAERARYPGIEERVLAVLDRHEMAAAAVVMAFEADTWHRVRRLRPDVCAGALYTSGWLGRGRAVGRAIEEARAGGAGFVGLPYAAVTAAAVNQAREAGVLLGAWTVNDREAMSRLVDLPVSVLITDRPDLGKELLDHRRRHP